MALCFKAFKSILESHDFMEKGWQHIIHLWFFFLLPVRDACKTSIQKRRWNILLPLQPCRGSRLNEVRGGRGDGLVTE